MCQAEGLSLQQGMNFRARARNSVILMSLRKGAPYADEVGDGRTLIYEGHDQPRTRGLADPKALDRLQKRPRASYTERPVLPRCNSNPRQRSAPGRCPRVRENASWNLGLNGTFHLVDAWAEEVDARRVFKFKLNIAEDDSANNVTANDIDHKRIIPTPGQA